MLLLTVLFLVMCGRRGPLTLEPEKLPLAVEDFTLSQVGKTIKLEWNFPGYLSDQKTQADISLVGKICAYYSTKKVDESKFRKKSTLYKTVKLAEVSEKENNYSIRIPFSLKNLDEKAHYFAVQYYYGRKKSPLSKVESIKTIIPVRPIEDLKISKEKKLLKLKWSKPFLNLSNKNIKGISGYHVYRHVQASKDSEAVKEFTRLNQAAILVEYFEDQGTGTDGSYSYYVTTINSDNIESDASGTVTVNMTDIYPPDPPANLAVFKAENHLYLTWEAVKDKDLSHYIVYKRAAADREKEEGEFKPLSDKVTDHYYQDTGVEKEVTYFYYVTAVDDKGNESSRSNIVKEKL